MSNGLIGSLTGGTVSTLYTYKNVEEIDLFLIFPSAGFGIICGSFFGLIIGGSIIAGKSGVISGKIIEDRANKMKLKIT
jgi:hypothetical protein